MTDTTSTPGLMPAAPIAECFYSRRWSLLPVLLTGQFLSAADFSIVNVALPSIRDGLKATSGEMQLIIAFYAVAYAVLLITGGRLGDLVGRKSMLLAGMAGFIAASAACGFAPTIEMLIVGRLVQGAAAAMMAPQILATIRIVFPPEERHRAIGYYSAAVGLGIVLGQLCGGLLIGWKPFGLTWQSIFLVNLPIGLVDLAAAAWLMPANQRLSKVRLDLPGVVTLSLGLVLLVYPLVAGREAGWPAWTLICLVASVPALGLFILIELRTMARGGSPLLDLRLFNERAFSIGLVLALMVYSSSSFFFSYAVFLQSGLGWTALAAGIAILPIGSGFFIGSLIAPRLVTRFGNRTPVLGYAGGIVGHGTVIALLLAGHDPGTAMYAAMMLGGTSLGVVFTALVRIVLADIQPVHAGMASGALSTAIQIGPAIFVPVFGGVFFTVLGTDPRVGAYQHALASVSACIVGTFVLGLVLMAFLNAPRRRAPAI